MDHSKDQLVEDAAAAKAAGLSYGKYKALQHEKLLPTVRRPQPKVTSGLLCPICGQPVPMRQGRRKYCGPVCADIASQQQEVARREDRHKKK